MSTEPGPALSGLDQWIREVVRDEVRRVLSEVRAPMDYMSTREAADLARVSAITVRRWIRDGRLGAAGAGRDLRVSRAELEALLEGRDARMSRTRPVVRRSPEQVAHEMLQKELDHLRRAGR